MESVPIFLLQGQLSARSYEGRTALVPKNGVCPYFLDDETLFLNAKGIKTTQQNNTTIPEAFTQL